MTPDLLRRVGETLYGGEAWTARLAVLFGVNRRTMQRWLSGKNPIPPEVAQRSVQLLDYRISKQSAERLALARDQTERRRLREQIFATSREQ